MLRLLAHPLAEDVVPPLDPSKGKNAPGLSGLELIINNLAVYGLYLAVAAIILGGIVAVAGPRIGFDHARSRGMGGIVGGIALAGLIAIARLLVNSSYSWFTPA